MDENGGNYEEESEEYILSQLRETFRDEAQELLVEMESALLDLENDPRNREVIDRAFRALHTLKGSGGTCEFTEISSFAHEIENFFDAVRKGDFGVTREFIALALIARDRLKEMLDARYGGPPADEGAEREVVASFSALLGKTAGDGGPGAAFIPGRIETPPSVSAEGDCKRLGEILVERGDLAPEEMEKVLSSQKRFGEILVESGLVTPEKVQSALAEQQTLREMERSSRKAEEAASVRVSVEKLDSLASLVGELVTVQAHLSRTAVAMEIPEFRAIAEQLERLSGNLHDRTMGIRMVPIETLFGRFRRVVHDLSRETGKETQLVTEGGETELDKTVIERLNDPLLHLIRNSIGHGIELPETREKAGKPRTGTIRLCAVHSGAHVLIRISDDGAGLDREAIHARGVTTGLIKPHAEPGEHDLLSLIFTPGFSTAGHVSDIAGRGVGLDVVKKAIDSLQGSIEVDSRPGAGTMITLKLPLTLAIIDGLLVRVGGESFILPLSFVRECVELTAAEKKGAGGRRIANVRGEIVPYIDMGEMFSIEKRSPATEQIVITEADGYRVGLLVDEVIGGHQTVIKNLGRMYRDVEGFSGATILSAGAVALILDVPGLVRFAEREEARISNRGV
ncbi:MAG TPA: chemotaxis protein CheA [Geobacteraceae bacterium]|nr:chemotaxis protein CheA [Geobacteraceae bacterium]